MDFSLIQKEDYPLFHSLANAYYREGEDARTPQDEVDAFIRFLFDRITDGEISGCFAKAGETHAGFALWAMDSEDFSFSRMPGLGTIAEIGLLPAFRSSGHGKELVSFAENALRTAGASQCYVSAYGPAENFWLRCGYEKTGETADNGLPILVKTLV